MIRHKIFNIVCGIEARSVCNVMSFTDATTIRLPLELIQMSLSETKFNHVVSMLYISPSSSYFNASAVITHERTEPEEFIK
jgi:hypothetical protein